MSSSRADARLAASAIRRLGFLLSGKERSEFVLATLLTHMFAMTQFKSYENETVMGMRMSTRLLPRGRFSCFLRDALFAHWLYPALVFRLFRGLGQP